MNQIEVNVTCSCGHYHQYLPENHQLVDGLYWFECLGGCKSTRTFIPELTLRRLEGQIQSSRKGRIVEERNRQNEWVKRDYKIQVKNISKLADEIDSNNKNRSEFTNKTELT